MKLFAGQRQLRDRSLGDEAPGLHDQYRVEVFEQVQAMDGGNHAGVFEHFKEIRIDARFGRRIEARSRLIEQDQTAAGRGEHATRQGDAGPLSA